MSQTALAMWPSTTHSALKIDSFQSQPPYPWRASPPPQDAVPDSTLLEGNSQAHQMPSGLAGPVLPKWSTWFINWGSGMVLQVSQSSKNQRREDNTIKGNTHEQGWSRPSRPRTWAQERFSSSRRSSVKRGEQQQRMKGVVWTHGRAWTYTQSC